MSNRYEDYSLLLNSFVQGEMSAEEFQRRYLDRFKNERRYFEEPVFKILDSLFGDVDAFSADPALLAKLETERPGFYLDEDRLRHRVADAYAQLATLRQGTGR